MSGSGGGYSSRVRIRIDLAYDGTDFSGWAKQPGLRTVQGVVEAALGRVLRLDEPVTVTVAGRTDAGVHAHGQVIHLEVDEPAWTRIPGRSDRQPGPALVHRLNAVLDDDVVIHAAAPAAPGFDARFSAILRHYEYQVQPAGTRRDPLLRRNQLWYPRPLDLDRLNAAAAICTGERDFAAFCKPRDGASTIRTLHEFVWSHRAETVIATLHADAFCHGMVRALVGACLAVGSGRRDLDWITDVTAQPARSPEVQVAPAHGLALMQVQYPRPEQLAARAQQARNRRTLPRSEPDDSGA